MPKIIVTSTFRKGGSSGKKGGAGGLLKYMGTREGVEKLPLDKGSKPATKRQQDLICSVVKKIPGTAVYPEYQEYLNSGTRCSATYFLNAVLEQEKDAEDIGKLVTYMAERPGVVKLGKHGLFSQTDEPIDLEKAADEVTNHPGYIWTHVVSLHREDAERLGYNNAEAWKSLVRRNVTTIAETHKIPLSDLQWYAAFHDTGHHPHIHLMVYSKGQEGYLSKQSIDSLRQDIKEKSEQKIRDLIAQAELNPQPDTQINFLLVKLRKQLDGHRGKKVYGYLPKSIKATVNEVVHLLASEPNIEKLYEEWNKVNREKLSLYYENKDPTVPLVDNKEFRSIKNTIIRAVLEMPQDARMQPVKSVQEQVVQLYPNNIPPTDDPLDDDSDSTNAADGAETKQVTIEIPKPVTQHTAAVATGIIGALARLIGDKCMAHRQSLQGQIDSKLRAKINEKKQALGLRTEQTQKPTYQTQEEYDMSM